MALGEPTPVESIEQAVWWLVKNLTDEEIKLLVAGAQQLPRCFKLVCDVFWVTEKQLIEKIKKNLREIGQ